MKQIYEKPSLKVSKLTDTDVITASGSAVDPTENPTLPNKDNEFDFDMLF